MKVYVETNPETIYSGRVKDEVKTTEIRMWFETDEEIEVQSLSDYTKQVRKEVCEEIRERLNQIINSIKYDPSFYDNEYRKSLELKAVYKNIFKILDQIQGETRRCDD
jgi:hypothetical protein